jgi:hypothetical protein
MILRSKAKGLHGAAAQRHSGERHRTQGLGSHSPFEEPVTHNGRARGMLST